MDWQAITATISGSGVGFLLGLLGGGGSVLAVPLLLYFVGVPNAHIAIGTSAVGVSLNAAANLIGHARRGSVRWPCAIAFALSGIVGAAIGSTIGKLIDPQPLTLLFAIAMVAVAVSMWRPRRGAEAVDVHLTPQIALRLVPIGLGVGLASGFFGIGGGFLIVPGLILGSGIGTMFLLKPADAQFLVSTAKFEPWKIIDGLAALVIFGWAFTLLGHWPAASAVLLSLLLLLSATLVLYSVWIMVIAAAFFVVRLDNLVYLFGAIFDFARWPVTVFKGFFRLFFTFVIPLGVMTTYPAQALLGTLSAQTALASIGGSLLFSLLARALWTRALGRYTSASS